jgi:transposase InsO family protein
VYLLKRKSDAFAAFKNCKAYAENLTGQHMGEFQMDKGGEYMSKAFLAYLRKHGIVVRKIVRNCPQQNGVAERANHTIEEHTTSMLEQAGLPDSFRGEAVGAYVHVRNMIPTAANPTTTPFELWYKKKPEVSNLRI